MVDSVISSREIYEDYAGCFPCFKAIFCVLGEVQHLGSAIFAGEKASLLWYKDMFDNGRQAVQYQALVQFVEVTQNVKLVCSFSSSMGPFVVSEGQQHVHVSRVSVGGVFLHTR